MAKLDLRNTLFAQMIGRGGIRRGMSAATYVASWGIARRDIGHDPSQAEYTAWWRQSLSTTTREIRAFKACVPEGVTIGDVWARLDPLVEVTDNRADVFAQVCACPGLAA